MNIGKHKNFKFTSTWFYKGKEIDSANIPEELKERFMQALKEVIEERKILAKLAE